MTNRRRVPVPRAPVAGLLEDVLHVNSCEGGKLGAELLNDSLSVHRMLLDRVEDIEPGIDQIGQERRSGDEISVTMEAEVVVARW